MTLEIVDPNSTELAHLTSVDVQFSGTHIGGGIYLATNHNPDTNGIIRTATPQSSLFGQAEAHNATEIDYVVEAGFNPALYEEDTDGDGIVDFTLAGFDTSLFYGDRLTSTGEFYDGPAAPLLIANDPNDLSGDITVTGFPSAANSLNGSPGVLHQSTGTLSSGNYFEQTIPGDTGGFYVIEDAIAVGGMSGGGTFLDFDPDGDGSLDTYLIATNARAGVIDNPGPNDTNIVVSTSFSPHYSDLAAAIESLTGDDARIADDFERNVLLSAQTAGSTLTTVQGEFFNEDIYGGINADTLLGAGGDDSLFGREGNDSIEGGTGDDTIDGGVGADTMSGGVGADFFAGTGFGGTTDIITDFEANLDIIDLGNFFATLDDVTAATTELTDGSILIQLPGSGAVQVLNTTISDLTTTNVNVICFAKGTNILTDQGQRPIETLQPGMSIHTHGGTYKQLQAVNMRKLGQQELRNRPNLWPIEIAAGALGANTPNMTLTVSPQHRILVNSKIADRMAEQPVLVAAKDLLGLPDVTQPKPSKPLCYYHLLFKTHEIIHANGCWSESFFPGDMATQTIPQSMRDEYDQIFAALLLPAAPILQRKKARNMVARHIKNNKDLQATTV